METAQPVWTTWSTACLSSHWKWGGFFPSVQCLPFLFQLTAITPCLFEVYHHEEPDVWGLDDLMIGSVKLLLDPPEAITSPGWKKLLSLSLSSQFQCSSHWPYWWLSAKLISCWCISSIWAHKTGAGIQDVHLWVEGGYTLPSSPGCGCLFVAVLLHCG